MDPKNASKILRICLRRNYSWRSRRSLESYPLLYLRRG